MAVAVGLVHGDRIVPVHGHSQVIHKLQEGHEGMVLGYSIPAIFKQDQRLFLP